MPDSSQLEPPLPFLDIKADQLEIPPELAKSLASLLVTWGTYENAILVDLEVLRQYVIARDLAPAIPFGFNKRIALWKRSIHRVFQIEQYRFAADEIALKSKIVSKHRNLLIHGHWRPLEKPGEFAVHPEDYSQPHRMLNVDIAASIHRDVMTVSNAFYGFLATRMWHGSLGLHKAQNVPLPDNPDRPPSPAQDSR